MPLPVLDIENASTGLPRQPVPLRFAYFVTGLPPDEFLGLLACRQEERYEYLAAYEYVEGSEPRLIRREFYEPIYNEAATCADALDAVQALLGRLPTNHFVWSDELAGAFSQYVRDTLGDEDANAKGVRLLWAPALLGADALVAECCDLSALVSAPVSAPVPEVKALTGRDIRKQTTAARHALWQHEYDRLKEENPFKTDSWIAKKISKLPAGDRAAIATIRKNMKGKKKKLGENLSPNSSPQ